MSFNESIVEDAALTWFEELGYAVGHGPQLAPGEPAAERDSFGEVVLVGRLREAVRRLNPSIPEEAREEALRKVLRVATTSLVQTNRAFHRMLRDGVDVEYPRPDGSIKGDRARLVDFADVRANDWFVVNQFTVIEAQHMRKELATHSPGSPGRTFSRTFCPGSVGVMKRFPGHSVREGCSLTTSETTTEQTSRHFSRQTVATASLRPSTTVSRQTSRQLGVMNKTDAEQEVKPAKYPAILAGFATQTNSRTFCPDGGRRRFGGSRHESRHGVAIFESLGGGIRNPEKLSGFCEATECASESRL